MQRDYWYGVDPPGQPATPSPGKPWGAKRRLNGTLAGPCAVHARCKNRPKSRCCLRDQALRVCWVTLIVRLLPGGAVYRQSTFLLMQWGSQCPRLGSDRERLILPRRAGLVPALLRRRLGEL